MNGLRRFARMIFRSHPFRIFWLARTDIDFEKEVGDGTGSSTVMAPLFWLASTFPEAPPALWQQLANQQEQQQAAHPMLRLLQRPNKFYTGPVLWMATLIDYYVDGNAYWLKVRSRAGTPVELWYVPHWMLEPKGDETAYITHYEYSVDGKLFRVDPDDVVHFRFGLDGDDNRKGRSRLKSVLREVFTDDEAASFTAQLLRNMGVPGLVISPDTDLPMQQEDIDEAKEYAKTQFTGDKRGEPMVFQGKTKVSQFGFSPEQLTLRELRRIPEERVTAVLGVPAIVAGLGAGLDRSTFTNMAEAREAAYESGIIPTQRILAEDVRFQLLTDFEEDVFSWRFGFDLARVRVLQEDLYRQAQRNDLAIRGGWMMVAEGRRAMNLEVDEFRDLVFLRPANVTEVSGTTDRIRPYAQASRNGSSTNGTNRAVSVDADAVAEQVIRAIERESLRAARTAS